MLGAPMQGSSQAAVSHAHDGLVWGVAGLRDSRVGAVGRACVGRVWVGPATPRTPALRHQTTHQGHSCGGGIIGATEQPVSRL